MRTALRTKNVKKSRKPPIQAKNDDCWADTNGVTLTDKARSYVDTHPWIQFDHDVRKINFRFWYLVGEARSKCQHLALTPLPPNVSERLESIYLAKGALATTAIEGNTLNEDQALQAVAGQLELPDSKEYLGIEIQNVIDAIAEIEDSVSSAAETVQVTADLLKHFNFMVLNNTPDADEDGVTPGEFRLDTRVVGSVYKTPHQDDTKYLVDKLCEWLNGPAFAPTDDPRETFVRVLLRAVVAHIYIAWIHPFGNGNGRTARLLEFNILTSGGLPSVTAHLFSNYYNETRSLYYAKLIETSRSGNDLHGFLMYAITGFVDQLQAQLHVVHGLVFNIAWRDYIYREFDGKVTPAIQRRRLLALTLTEVPVPPNEIADLSVELARQYAGKQSKTVTRDINSLVSRGLAARTPEGVRARRELMSGFFPSASKSTSIF